jgi:putative oxidoreductase
MKYVLVLGRFLYSLIFLFTMKGNFTSHAIEFAESKNVPLAFIMVPLSGIIAIIGGLSILLGYKAKIGGWLIIIFLIPVTFLMHAFWNETDPMQIQMQVGNFMKNMALIGAAIYITYFGAGPISIDSLISRTGS